MALLAAAIPPEPGTWADVGSGDGTFTRALVELLGPESRVYAVDRDARAITALGGSLSRSGNVVPVEADFTRAFDLPGLDSTMLDGMLLANALHFVQDAETVLTRLVQRVRPGGRVVLIEYDRRAASRWVPFPIPRARLPALARAAGLSRPTVTATRPSDYGGVLYVAAADRTEQRKRDYLR